MSNGDEAQGAHDERVKRASERLRELQASGVELLEILCGPYAVRLESRS